jgi:hypothetical protein
MIIIMSFMNLWIILPIKWEWLLIKDSIFLTHIIVEKELFISRIFKPFHCHTGNALLDYG